MLKITLIQSSLIQLSLIQSLLINYFFSPNELENKYVIITQCLMRVELILAPTGPTLLTTERHGWAAAALPEAEASIAELAAEELRTC